MFIKRERFEQLVTAEAAFAAIERALVEANRRIEELKTDTQLLKDRNDREQQRADSALQTMVAHKTGVAVPMPQVAPSTEYDDPHAEVPSVVEELRERARKEGPLKVLLEEHEATS